VQQGRRRKQNVNGQEISPFVKDLCLRCSPAHLISHSREFKIGWLCVPLYTRIGCASGVVYRRVRERKGWLALFGVRSRGLAVLVSTYEYTSCSTLLRKHEQKVNTRPWILQNVHKIRHAMSCHISDAALLHSSAFVVKRSTKVDSALVCDKASVFVCPWIRYFDWFSAL
jgi:hypothetical protein